MKHSFTCIICPLSCQVELTEEENSIVDIRGHTCPQGEEYVRNEFVNPVRTLTTTVSVRGGVLSVLPVRSKTPIPKGLMRACVEELNRITLEAPVTCGDVVCRDILGTGVDVVASRDLRMVK